MCGTSQRCASYQLALQLRQQRWIPMSLVLNVLDMTGSAVGLVRGDYLAVGFRINASVVAAATGLPRSLAIDRVERLVATGAR